MRLLALVIASILTFSGDVLAQTAQTPDNTLAVTQQRPDTSKDNRPQIDTATTGQQPQIVPIEQTNASQKENAPPKPWWEPLLQPIVAALAGLSGALIGAWVGRSNTVASINQKANELEIKEIQTRLNEFYGRFQQVADENHLIAREFKAHHGDPAMRTLLRLLDPVWRETLSPSDEAIVKSLVDNGNVLRTLIREKSGLVDAAILPYLSRAALHFSMLELAKEGKLDNEPLRFERFVYPKVLDEVLVLEMGRLNCRIRKLVENSSAAHPPLESLKIPDRLALPDWV
ncbi:hypothetical protein [Pleomorphomonas sp. PLEO]|uniref:hypothetical protein n=1 Tax=Pleomorphomonas sp. PLEO TaxID=3239306 RepID=UPI00351F0A3C